jgi:putative tryptophan/tyrosine transport system substrate-binding protein
MMDRRAFIGTLAGSLLAAPLAAEAQLAGKVPRIGVLAPGRPPLPPFDALRDGLRGLGYIEGQTIVLESRWDEDKPDRHPALAVDLVRLRVDVIIAGTTPMAVAAKQATGTIPIVMAAVSDPVGTGLVASLPRPGGNVTGMSLLSAELSGKRIEILKEAIPGLSRIAILWNPRNPISTRLLKDTQAAAQSLGVQFQVLEVRSPADLDGAFRAATNGGAQALATLQDSMFYVHRARIAELELKDRLPTMSGENLFASAGGLMNYGANIDDSWRRSAVYVDKILKGAKPADLPVEQVTKFELVINLKTAKALGLTIPPALLQRADQVIE